ncbi:GNAT family N-acetyltransferase [Promicromonospora thailandica]|uniref:Transcriptional regulator, MarR family with acetyltransferase activity n=1 Tax=Promicromonospora thailandica TaxID=765201 RepID=A0A9X2K0X0_9MICO|nr:bifunctional helix-turn-helix transcriptional regulator/GNAT family N-acetyltransferase [Promicromonospora thailandica]MCP2267469.1 transcriptional regulator, MarR family with acetyltransferase activity [Promicromonospora thailandica]BFF21274.1 helix-turn-helix domain-containing GNAT family N-acetyltransferase [Promicromonospora thailandica]
MSLVDTVRRFNRSYTQRIGALEESFLGTGRPLGASRLLFEVGPGGATVRDLRERLDLDSGYLTRLLSRLADDGLVEVLTDPADRRRRTVTLTAGGQAAYQELDDRSERTARDLLEPLTERQRARLDEALRTADLLIRAATVHLRVVDPLDRAATAALGEYYAELGRRFPGGFDPGAPEGGADALRAPRGAFLVATSDGVPVACGGVRLLGDATGEIKRMWVHPGWRGAGLGTRLLRALEDEARRLGCTRAVLDSNRVLTEALAMYGRAGYREIEPYSLDNPYADAFFEKPLRGEGGYDRP